MHSTEEIENELEVIAVAASIESYLRFKKSSDAGKGDEEAFQDSDIMAVIRQTAEKENVSEADLTRLFVERGMGILLMSPLALSSIAILNGLEKSMNNLKNSLES